MANKLLAKSPITESSIRVTVQFNDTGKSQEWEGCSGGDKTAAVAKTRVGYDPNLTLVTPSVSDSGDISITRIMVVPDVWELQAWLLDQVGRGTAKVWKTPMGSIGSDDWLDSSNVTSLVYEGVISGCTTVNASNQSTASAQITVTITGGSWKKAA
jgi:hypothetical protein